ncbi:rod-binding protein [Vibrio proteolyticus]|uniref:Flagellar protein FlgJ N-terminal domain-containing protein n=1 Tax=Vibrio proteolyticus NBRC 13287 TaxID=1219065 RepID=U2ZXT9_VIBPR|nr:rod-binding protein [Vibrio proteolyticus]GAD66245.1 hypothetical protein VPR01S_03_01540 [Vibrio proteolyticus NBRC 13287]
MKLDAMKDQAQMNAVLYHDNNALTNIKHSRDHKAALETVAGQFEAMFLQMVLRQMRSSSDVLADKDSPFSSQQHGVFRDMYDGQLAIEMAKKQQSGIADMLVKQLSPSMAEAQFDTRVAAPANDEPPHNEVEASSRLDEHEQSELTQLINSSAEAVASVKQLLQQVSVTSAFTQPLIRKMEL